MAINIVSFETRVASVCQKLLDLVGEIEEVTTLAWPNSTGANYEAEYNDLTNQDDIPASGKVTKNEMNNCQSALSSLKADIEAAGGSISKVAEAWR